MTSLRPPFTSRRDDSIFLVDTDTAALNSFKMTKTRTAMFLVMITLGCALIFSITDAHPAPDSEPEEDYEEKLGNNSRLVITHVVKTIEFEVGVVDDDGTLDVNSTDSDSSEFYETDIQLLNVDLLKEVVSQADAEENKEQVADTVKEEKTEGQEAKAQNRTR